MTKNDAVRGTLAWCNEMRVERNVGPPLEELPKGHRHSPESCPCGAASGLFVTRAAARDPNTNALVCLLPYAVRQFVQSFDAGLLPEFVL